ncbi:MAG: sugar phosphate isomerase/epimerase [Christensenellaceae bacterium]|jgi:sugar phosphate isomerase/epimerase|nr:sugar phosphate isomerase/epimerase [Christensenellaceae bacterium]
MVKISGFYDEASLQLDRQITLIKSLGGKYLCPRRINGRGITDFTADEFVRDVWPVLEKNNIKLSSLGSSIGKIPLADDTAYEAQKKKLVELIKIAEHTGCKYIRCFSFFCGEVITKKTGDDVVKKWQGFLSLAEGHDIILLHENEKKIYGDVPERVIELHDRLNHPQMKLCYDASNYIQCGVDARKAFLETKDRTVYYHMKDCLNGVEVPLGTGSGQILELLEDLISSGYSGFLTLEPHTAKYATFKRLFAFIPFLACTKMGKVFKQIDKTAGVRRFQKVSREEVFKWQYNNLVEMLKKITGRDDYE